MLLNDKFWIRFLSPSAAPEIEELKRMSYDGRSPDIPWRKQNIATMGYHYYMTPETAELGISKFPSACNEIPRQWLVTDWPDLTKMKIFEE